MSDSPLDGVSVAILATDGFEQSELLSPQKALKDAGATVHIVSLKSGSIKGWDEKDWGDSVDVDKPVADVSADDYAALMLPGGQMNPDLLRVNDDAVAFVKSFVDAGKPVAAICHASWTMIEAGVVRGRDMTSYPSVSTDLKNAGANWHDKEVVVCTSGPSTFVTSRNPDDLPAFNAQIIETFAATKA